MIFTETSFIGAFLIDLDPRLDSRGYFARTYCAEEFKEHGLDLTVVQANLSYNLKAGTLRGLHFQQPPYAEPKLIRCIRGEVFCAAVDLRPSSKTYKQTLATTLNGFDQRALFIPRGFANGFLTLKDETMIEYQMGEFYDQDSAMGYRYDDPVFAIDWPSEVAIISEKDLAWPAFVS